MLRLRIQMLAAVLAWAMLATVASAGTILDNVPQSAYLNLGASPAYQSVGQLSFTSGTSAYVGSGTLIAPDWVLTAAHCVAGASTETFTVGGKTYTGDTWTPYPSWSGNLTAGYDIALIHLTSDVGNVTPAKLYNGSSEIGSVATLVGYGKTGTGSTGATTYDGQKRAGQNMLDSYLPGSGNRVMLTDFDNPNRSWGWVDNKTGSSAALPLEYMTAPGDSGGGVFIDTSNGPELAGVTSFSMAYDGNPNSSYGDLGGYTRTSSFLDWIDSTLASGLARSSGLYSARGGSGNVSAMPEPATLTLLGLGALALLRRRGVKRKH